MTLIRLLKIVAAVARNRLDNLIDSERSPFWLRCLLVLLPWRYVIRNNAPRGERVRLSLEALGPIFIKFGQILSTRRDLLPDDVSDELSRLQDDVPPFPAAEAIGIIESSLGSDVDTLFARFDREPLASASVAQVHTAQLHTGEEVVVKVIRPGIDRVIRKDIGLMYLFARVLIALSKDARRLRPVEVVADYERTILDELDLLREAANCSQLRRNFLTSPLLFVPQVYWDYCRTKVMVVERIYGVPVSDIAMMKAQHVDMKKLAERGVEIFFTQVFRDRFFHADMHPGNIFIDTTNPAEPRYIGIDCGIIGTLEPEDQHYLASNLLAFFRRDYRKVAQLHVDSGWVPRDTPVGELEAAIRTVCEPIFEKPLKDISFGQLLVRLFQVARRFNMQVQPQLVLLEKTLLNVEGLGRQLYPDLDLWATAQPYLEKWMKDQVSPTGIFCDIKEQSADWLLSAPVMAQRVMSTVRTLVDQQQALHHQQVRAEKRQQKQRRFGVLLLLAGGVLMVTSGSLFVEKELLDQTMVGLLAVAMGGWLVVR
ncbi:ubiquinone biosynthesis regulatory protein kinase UbiB [Endozoicomonas sp. GU-1]|uniref:ubiquinone biosynthesis regulatory protein kinase UbiB n=1 Tax=Endozoicomonas sp. GU-1 TaxID=3009078 RepID=UPI0022B33F6C|nr:ubiquinone biosynthesis regulatory protein kinase UbiB [Endozoicomonas sp. GU-1]WBA88887.1 ubiquinone biosynthesis regulatory protein kinase UbiB [Endozoicomonas sp. GU-1]